MLLLAVLACASPEPEGVTPSETDTEADTAAPDSGEETDPPDDTGDCAPRSWYADADGDGWGADSVPVEACAPPDGHVGRGGDCDDAAPEVFPGALDVADGVDQDCDGAPDDVRVDLVFDPDGATHAWMGLGAHVWIWDDAWPAVLTALGGRFIRSSLYSLDDPDSAPAGGTADAFDAWLLTHDTAHVEAVSTVLAAEAAGLRTMALVWEAPPAWETAGALDTAHVEDYAQLIAAILGRLDQAGATPDWVELVNEPDGDWNTYVRPTDWAALVEATREALDARGLTAVDIVGPGAAFASNTPAWMDAWGGGEALGGFSAHLWDDATGEGDGVAITAEALDAFVGAAGVADPGRRLPRFVTELGSKDTALFGVPTNPADACGDFPDQPLYATRLFAYTLLAATRGVNGVAVWQASDLDWGGCWGTWGLVDTSGAPRPSLGVLARLAVGPDARVVPPRWDDPELAVAAFVEPDQLTLALANPTASDVRRAIGLGGATAWTLSESLGDEVGPIAVYDPLDGSTLGTIRGSAWFDTTNTGYFDGDAGRLTAYDDPTVTWSFGADLRGFEATLWVWSRIGEVSWEISPDGAAWTTLVPDATEPADGNWDSAALRADSLPAGTRHLRMAFEPRAIDWTPQLGEIQFTLEPGAAAVVDTLGSDRVLTVDVPAGGTRVLRVARAAP